MISFRSAVRSTLALAASSLAIQAVAAPPPVSRDAAFVDTFREIVETDSSITTGSCTAVADKVESLPEVDYLVICAGGFDLMAEVVAEDDDHLLEILNRRIRPIPGVTRTETFVYLQLRKQIYTWGTR